MSVLSVSCIRGIGGCDISVFIDQNLDNHLGRLCRTQPMYDLRSTTGGLNMRKQLAF